MTGGKTNALLRYSHVQDRSDPVSCPAEHRSLRQAMIVGENARDG